MAFLTAEQLKSLTIERMIFHVVGTGKPKATLLDEIEPGSYTDFFIERLQSTANGIMYDFLPTSSVLASLRRTTADPTVFIRESQVLAETFHEAHMTGAIEGAFVIFALNSSDGPLHAFVKFDQEEVLSYHITAKDGKRKANIDKLVDTIVKSPDALQKSAIIKLSGTGGELSVRDRAGKGQITRYFETFLGAKRRFDSADLTKQLAGIAKAVARENRDELPQDVANNAGTRIYKAIQTLDGYDPASREFETVVFGAVADDSKVRRDFQRFMRVARIDSESFNFDRTAVARPTRHRITTLEGIVITYDNKAARYITKEDAPGGRTRITIDTGSYSEDDDA